MGSRKRTYRSILLCGLCLICFGLNAQHIKLNNIERSNGNYNFLSISDPFDGYFGLTDTNGVQRYAHVDTLLIREVYADGDSLCFVFFDTTLCVDGVIGGSLADLNLAEDNLAQTGMRLYDFNGYSMYMSESDTFLINQDASGATNIFRLTDAKVFTKRSSTTHSTEIEQNQTEIILEVIQGGSDSTTVLYMSLAGAQLYHTVAGLNASIELSNGIVTITPDGNIFRIMNVQSASPIDSVMMITTGGTVRMMHPQELFDLYGSEITGLEVDEVLFGAEDNTVEQTSKFRYINNDSLVLDSSFTINGVSGLTPTTVKVLKSGLVEWNQTVNDEGFWRIWRVNDLQQDRGNVSYSAYINSTNFPDGYRNDFTYQDGFNAGEGGTAEIDTLPGFYRSREFEYAQDDSTTFSELHEFFVLDGTNQYRIESTVLDWERLNTWYRYYTIDRLFLNDPVQHGLANNFPYFSVSANDSTGVFLDLMQSGAEEGFRFFSWPADDRIALRSIENAGVVTLDIFQDKPFASIVNLEYLNYQPSGAAATSVAGRDASGFITGVNLTDGIELTSGNLGLNWDILIDSLAANSPTDSVFSMGDLICIVTSAMDTICGDTAFYDQDLGVFCVVFELDTTCVEFTPAGVTYYSGNSALTSNRTVQMAGYYSWWRDGSKSYFQIDPSEDGTDPSVLTWNKNNNGATISLNGTGNQSNDIYTWYNGVTAAGFIKDYYEGVDVSAASFVFGESNLFASDNVWEYHGDADSLNILKGVKLDGILWDEDGDIGSTGDVLTKQADGTVNWAAAGGSDTNFFEDNLSQTGVRAHQANNNATQISEVSTFEWIGNSGTNSLSFQDASSFSTTITNGTETGSLSVTPTQAYLNVLGAVEESGLTLSETGDLTLNSTTGAYLLGTDPDAGASTDSVLVYNNTTNQMRMRHAGLFAGGSGDPSVWYESGATPANAIGDEIYHTGDTHIGDSGMSGLGKLNVLSTGVGLDIDAASIGILVESSSSASINAIRADASTNTELQTVLLQRNTSGTAANGIGLSLESTIETSTGSSGTASLLNSVWTDATHATRTSRFDIHTTNSATTARKLSIAGTGQLTLDAYTGTNFAGASTDSVLVVNATTGVVGKRHAGLFTSGGSYTDEQAQDAVGGMVDASLNYVDGTPLLQRAALTGAITASAGSNATVLGSFSTASLNTALNDNDIATLAGTETLTNKRINKRVVALTDAATIAVNSDNMDIGTVTLGGNRTLGNPTGTPVDGQMLEIRFRQDGTGTRTMAYDTQYRFGTDITGGTLTTTINKTDYIIFQFNSTDTKWDCVGFVRGY